MMRVLIFLLLQTFIGYSQFDSTFQKLNPNSSHVGKTHIGFGFNSGNKVEKSSWIYPETQYLVDQYELMEIAINLPSSIDKKINHFLQTDDSVGGINPFLEWQLNVKASFINTETFEKHNIDAFYYQDFERDTSDTDFRKWDWVAKKTPNYMRVRFAPPSPGEWFCSISIKTKEAQFDQYDRIVFNVQRSNNKGYLKIGPNKRYFVRGEDTFFPSGQNLVSPRCEFCFTNPLMDLPSKTNGPAQQAFEGWMKNPTILKGFLIFEDYMRSLAASGGNYFREILYPQNQDIEWEKLGNYYGRMNRAWELDQQFKLAKELDLTIQLNLQIQYALEVENSRTWWNWSYDESDQRHAKPDFPCANPYNLQIESTKNDDPNTFFSDEVAKKYYKQKLRYIVSRWGYSTNLGVIGIVSEMEGCCSIPQLCVTWMNEMANYLKKDLRINQILTPSFVGIFHNASEYEHPILKDSLFDMSAYNWYAAAATKFQGNIKHVDNMTSMFNQPFYYGEIGNGDLYPCDTKRIEWVRDAWMSTFSGNAGIGMNWDEPFDDKLRRNLGNIQRFVYGINFDGEETPWFPTRIISENRKAETMMLVSPDKTAAIGVISNRYYNWYQYGDTTGKLWNRPDLCQNRIPHDPGFHPDKPIDEKGIWERIYDESPQDYIDKVNGSVMNDSVVFTPFQTIQHNDGKFYRLRLYDMKRSRYTIDFYNALTMQFIGRTYNWGPNLQIEYPEMDEKTGLIAFKISKSGMESFPQTKVHDQVPIYYEQAEYSREFNRILIKNNRYQILIDPINNQLSIDHFNARKGDLFKLTLLSDSDKIILDESYKKSSERFKTPELSTGIYKIMLVINRVHYSEKIIIE